MKILNVPIANLIRALGLLSLLLIIFSLNNHAFASFGKFNADTDEGLQFLKERRSSLVTMGNEHEKDDTAPQNLLLKYGPESSMTGKILVLNISSEHPEVLGNLGFCVHLFQHFPTCIVWNTGDLKGLVYQKFGTRAIYKDLVGLSLGIDVPKTGLLPMLDTLLKFGAHKTKLRFLKLGTMLDDEDFNTIGGAIKGLELLSIFDLSGQINLGSYGLRILGEIMAESPHLKALILQNLDLSKQTTFPTVWPKQLTYIDLRGSKILPAALKPLLESSKKFRFSDKWVEGDFDREFALGLLNKSLTNTGGGLPEVLLARPHFEKLLDTFAKIPMLAGLVTLIGKDLNLEDIKSIQSLLAHGSNMDLQSNILMGKGSSGAKATWTDFHSVATRNGYKQTSGTFELKNTGDRSGVRHWAAYRLIQYLHDSGATVSLRIKEKTGSFRLDGEGIKKLPKDFPAEDHNSSAACGFDGRFSGRVSFYAPGIDALEAMIDVMPYAMPNCEVIRIRLDGENKTFTESIPARTKRSSELVKRFFDTLNSTSYTPHFMGDSKKQAYKQTNILKVTQFGSSQLHIDDSAAQIIANAMRHQRDLEGFDIRNMCYTSSGYVKAGIGDVGASVIATSMANWPKLSYLSFDNNKIGDSGITAIARSLRYNTNLQQLSLNDNPFGDTGVMYIGPALQFTPKLQKLSMRKTNMTWAYCLQVLGQYVGSTKRDKKFGRSTYWITLGGSGMEKRTYDKRHGELIQSWYAQQTPLHFGVSFYEEDK